GRSTVDRRTVLWTGIRLAFVVPAIATFPARQARAAGSNLSCYPDGHACPGQEACCDGLVCSGGTCSAGASCSGSGSLCSVNADCCSNSCSFGTCD
ncbi:MAG: hypothetical protein ACPGXK_13010, partial [Phycisphaerae bacterium]